MNETYLIDELGNNIKIPYYEIGAFAKEKVNEYIKDSINAKDFEDFRKNYTVYEPYFDYLICKMHYKIENPFIFSSGTLMGKNDRFIYKNLLEYNYPKVSDTDLKIAPFNIEQIADEIIDPLGIVYKIDRTRDITHEETYEIILMEKMINNKRLYEDYVQSKTLDPDTYYNINAYFRNKLGYAQMTVYKDGKSGFILSNPDVAPEYIQNIVRTIENMHPDIQIKYDGSQRYRTRK